jgi:hypothetical protein
VVLTPNFPAALDREQPVRFGSNGRVTGGCSRPVSFTLGFMSTSSDEHDYSMRNFRADILAATGLPVVAVALLASWVLSIHGIAWIWAAGVSLAVAVLGAVLLFIAKLSLYRQGRFFTFGIQALPVTSHRFYRWGGRCSLLGIVAMFVLWLASTSWH